MATRKRDGVSGNNSSVSPRGGQEKSSNVSGSLDTLTEAFREALEAVQNKMIGPDPSLCFWTISGHQTPMGLKLIPSFWPHLIVRSNETLTPEQEVEIAMALEECQSVAESISRQMDVNLSLLEDSRLEVHTAVEIVRDSNLRSEMRLSKAV